MESTAASRRAIPGTARNAYGRLGVLDKDMADVLRPAQMREAIAMTRFRLNPLGVIATAALFTLAVAAPPALAAEDGGSRFPPPNYPSEQKSQKSQKTQKKKKQNQGELREQYQRARALIMGGEYEAGIAAMHALGHDDNPEIANFIGYASRKLGRYEDSKYWYERALAADPNHVRTWSYYGMWHAEQGNKLMAQDYLEKVRLICGNTSCEEYVKLKGVIEGTMTY
jgi:tetratricopeptide (TPR) repeat protein